MGTVSRGWDVKTQNATSTDTGGNTARCRVPVVCIPSWSPGRPGAAARCHCPVSYCTLQPGNPWNSKFYIRFLLAMCPLHTIVCRHHLYSREQNLVPALKEHPASRKKK